MGSRYVPTFFAVPFTHLKLSRNPKLCHWMLSFFTSVCGTFIFQLSFSIAGVVHVHATDAPCFAAITLQPTPVSGRHTHPKCRQGSERGNRHLHASCFPRLGNRIAVATGMFFPCISKCWLFVYHPPIEVLQESKRSGRPAAYCLLGVLFFSFTAHNHFSMPWSQLRNSCFLIYACAVN